VEFVCDVGLFIIFGREVGDGRNVLQDDPKNDVGKNKKMEKG
jgi:hypothetical protein